MDLKMKDSRRGFYQWDTGQKLILEGAEDCQEVHFSRPGESGTLVCRIYKTEAGYFVDVPNTLLQKDGRFVAFLYQHDSNGTETRYTKSFLVHSRPKPDDYVYSETEVQRYTDLEARIQTLEQKETTPGVKSWNDLMDKPFGTSNDEAILGPTEVVFENVDQIISITKIPFIEGEIYTLICNGVEYEVKPFFDYEMGDCFLRFWDYDTETGCPVYFSGSILVENSTYVYGSGSLEYIMLSGNEFGHYMIEIRNRSKIKTLDEKYLPYQTEVWRFELENGNTVDKQVVVRI